MESINKKCICGHRSKGYKDADFNKKVIKAGMIVEFEHTCDPKVARRIAEDHVTELGNQYYEELDNLEKKLSKLHQDLPDNRKTVCPSVIQKHREYTKSTIKPSQINSLTAYRVINPSEKSTITSLTTQQVMKPISRFEDIYN